MRPRVSQSGGKRGPGACGGRRESYSVSLRACAVRRGTPEATRMMLKVRQMGKYPRPVKSYFASSGNAITLEETFFTSSKSLFTSSKLFYPLNEKVFARSATSVYCANRLSASSERYEASALCEATRAGPVAPENRARTGQGRPPARRAQVAAIRILRKMTRAAIEATRNCSAATQNRWLR